MRTFLGCFLAIALIASGTGTASPATGKPAPSARRGISRAQAIAYSDPAGTRPDGPLSAADPYRAIIPNGRIVAPAGASTVVGMNALGVALSPDGRYAIVSDDDDAGAAARSALDPQVGGGMSLSTVDTATMRVVAQYRAPDAAFFVGVVAVRDPRAPERTLVFASDGAHDAVRVFSLGADGRLAPSRIAAIAIPGGSDPAFADYGRAFPATLVASADGRYVYVVDNLSDTVRAIDTRTEALAGPVLPVGFFPLGATLAGDRLLVVNEGLMRYARAAAPAAVPPFRAVASDLAHASSLSILALGPDGDFPAAPSDATDVPMDPTPDGLRTVGGAHPAAVVASPDGAYAFVAMAGVDRIATVDLRGEPHVVGGTELRLFDRGPYGTQPDALALSRDGKRLYVALAGLDAVAVVDAHDPLHLHRLGLIPTGWDPTALALSPDDKTLYVANAKGFGVAAGDATPAVWATLQRIDVASLDLYATTRTALDDTRVARPAARDAIVPQTVLDGASTAIRHVVFVVVGDGSYDAALGPAAPTPNLHRLARTFGVAANLFADAGSSGPGEQFAAAGIVTPYGERTFAAAAGRGLAAGRGDDPEDAPRAGTIFASLRRNGISYRDYGGLLSLAGYAPGGVDPGLGGSYALDVPAPPALAGHVDLRYPGADPEIDDVARAREFVRDYGALVAAGRAPAYAYVRLSATGGPNAAADADRAVGAIVAAISHSSVWRSAAIFVTPAAAEGPDHVAARRAYALVVSPYAKRGYVGRRHLSTVSVLKTTEELLGVPALSLGDLLASDMADFFTPHPNFAPYVAATAATP